MTAVFTQLLSSPFRLIDATDDQPPPLHERTKPQNHKETASPCLASASSFPLAHLPYEIRQLIYMHYFASLPTRHITCSNARLPHHSLTPLAISSSYLEFDPSPNIFYRQATFSFACPDALKTFSKNLSAGSERDRGKDVGKVKVMYGRYDQPSRDWVYLLTSNFPSLEEVTFSVDREKRGLGVGHPCFGNWWSCVRDAIREGLKGSKEILLRVEDGEWGVVEVVKVQQKV